MKKYQLNSAIIHYRLSFILLTVGIYLIFFSPLLSAFSTHTTSPNDGPLIIWLVHQSANYWKGMGDAYHWPFFHPYPYTATYSDPFITLGLLLIPLEFISNRPIFQYNALLLLSSLSTFIAMYILAKELWKTTLTAWVSAVFFCFSFLYLQFIVHAHTFFIAGIPLALFALIRYLKTRHYGYLALLSAAFLVQALNAPLTAYFIVAILAIYVLSENKLSQLIKNKSLQLMVVLLLGICLWFYIPYFITADTFDAQRTIRDAAHFSFSLERLLWPDILLPSVLLLSCYFFRQTKEKKYSLQPRTWLFMMVVGGFFMLGPVIKVADQTLKIFETAIPLPYAIAYYVLPGISAFRAVTRWSIVFHFGLTLGIGWLLHRYTIRLRVLVGLLTLWLLLMVLLYQKHTQLFFIESTVPPIYETVIQTEGQVLAEFPITQWDMVPFDGLENQRLLRQLQHKKKLYNGVSGFMPQQRAAEIHLHFQNFPNNKSLHILKRAEVDLIVVHYDEYQRMAEQNFNYGNFQAPPLEEVLGAVENQRQLELVSCTTVPFDCLYRLSK